MQKTRTQTLSSTERALMAYLDDMLRESTAEPELVVPVVAPPPPVVVAPSPVVSAPVPAPVATAPVAVKPAVIPVAEPVPAKPVVRVSAPVEHSVRVDAPMIEIPLPRIEVPVPAVVVAPPPQPAVAREPSVRVETPVVVETPPVRRSSPDTSTEAIPTLPSLPDWLDQGRPQWADAPFEALIFRVGGLKMAVPLVSLGLIHPIQKRFNELPGQNPWFLGMLRTPQSTIRVIDTALCVMPERHDPEMRDSLKYVITLHGYEWGLAAHDVEKAIQLDPSKIQWRTRRGKRPWLAGTVVDHMCALIDSEGFHQVIAAAESSS